MGPELREVRDPWAVNPPPPSIPGFVDLVTAANNVGGVNNHLKYQLSPFEFSSVVPWASHG